MLDIRRSADRGHAQHGWLESYHTFSFADYYDPRHSGYGVLFVLNDDRVQPGAGFAMHSHRDMEIITYVLAGALAHKDSMGNTSVIVPGDVQRMSAGTGVRHSEYNADPSAVTHFLQIWIEPNRKGVAPSYQQTAYPPGERRGRLRLIVSPDGREGSLSMSQDAFLYAGLVDGDERASLELRAGRKGYLHVARGSVTVNGVRLGAGDGVKSATGLIDVVGGQDAEVLLFDLP